MMPNEEQLKKEFVELIGRHRKLIEFLCLRASYGQENYYRDFMQECYIKLLVAMSDRKSAMSEPHEKIWVYWQCRDAISRFRNGLKRFPKLLHDDLFADSLEASREVSQLTIDDLSVCLDDTERHCFFLMASALPDDEIEHEMELSHSDLLLMRHKIKKKIHHFLEHKNNGKQQ